jgi:hypothetical protein
VANASLFPAQSGSPVQVRVFAIKSALLSNKSNLFPTER